MSPDGAPAVSLTLTTAQVQHVVRAAFAGDAPGLQVLLGGAAGASPRAASSAATSAATEPGAGASSHEDRRLSRSLLRGLAMLARFGPDAPERGIVELAGELRMSPSTAHRYAQTLVEAGLLERVAATRKYRLAGAGPGA